MESTSTMAERPQWTREQTLALIAELRKNRVLWEPSPSKCYKDRQRKASSWQSVDDATGLGVEACKKRVESLLASCRRERVKIAKSRAEDPPEQQYRPSWAYWKDLQFLRGEADEAGDSNEQETSEKRQWKLSSRRPPRIRKKATPPEAHVQKPLSDEFEAYGVTVAAKLRRMDPRQRLYAENLINQTLYRGLTFQLSPAEAFPQPGIEQQQQVQPSTVDLPYITQVYQHESKDSGGGQ